MRNNETPYKKPLVIVPKNEGKACDAVVKTMERRAQKVRSEIRHPERDRVGPPVELRLKLGEQEYAVEHTIIEPFENNIKAELTVGEIRQYLIQSLTGQLPGPMYYVLQVPKDVCLPRGKVKRVRALKILAEWIQSSAQIMYERNTVLSLPIESHGIPVSPYCWPDDSVKDKPSGLNCTVELLRWRNGIVIGRKPGFVQTILTIQRIWRVFEQSVFVELSLTNFQSWRSVVLKEHEPSWFWKARTQLIRDSISSGTSYLRCWLGALTCLTRFSWLNQIWDSGGYIP